jgi:hypothetical protein
MKKSIFFTYFLFIFSFTIFAQEKSTDKNTEKVFRINFINPGLEYELPTGKNTTFSGGIGAGYNGSYPDLSIQKESGFLYIIAPFLDLQEKFYYNFEKRKDKGKSIVNNSGNFVSLRFLTRGPSIEENVVRSTEYDFAISATWGIQRSINEKIHLLFDVGPMYYFDGQGRGNFFPLILQLNIGLDL